MPDSQLDVQELKQLAIHCAQQGGQLALEMQSAGLGETDSKSSLTDLVTRADRAVEVLITKLITERRPHDAILGEEDGATQGTSGLTWVVDPIDGTVNFYYGYPGWVVSVAAESDQYGFQAGAIYDPIHNDLYTASLAGGAELNQQPITPPARETPDQTILALVATGFGYQPEQRQHQAKVLNHLLPKVRDIRRGGAAAMDLCHLATGRIDAYFERNLNPWDYAAGLLIARESGCTVEILEQDTQGKTFLLGARTPELFHQLKELLQEAGA